VVRTVEEVVDAGSGLHLEQMVQVGVNRRQIIVCQPAERDAALIGNDQDPEAGVVEPADRRGDTVEEAQLAGSLYVLPLARSLDVDGAVAIQEGGSGIFQDAGQSSLSTNSKIVCPTSI
jgi:hypothetical protein